MYIVKFKLMYIMISITFKTLSYVHFNTQKSNCKTNTRITNYIHVQAMRSNSQAVFFKRTN